MKRINVIYVIGNRDRNNWFGLKFMLFLIFIVNFYKWDVIVFLKIKEMEDGGYFLNLYCVLYI